MAGGVEKMRRVETMLPFKAARRTGECISCTDRDIVVIDLYHITGSCLPCLQDEALKQQNPADFRI